MVAEFYWSADVSIYYDPLLDKTKYDDDDDDREREREREMLTSQLNYLLKSFLNHPLFLPVARQASSVPCIIFLLRVISIVGGYIWAWSHFWSSAFGFASPIIIWNGVGRWGRKMRCW